MTGEAPRFLGGCESAYTFGDYFSYCLVLLRTKVMLIYRVTYALRVEATFPNTTLGQSPRNAEINNLYLTIFVYKNICWFDIAMEYV